WALLCLFLGVREMGFVASVSGGKRDKETDQHEGNQSGAHQIIRGLLCLFLGIATLGVDEDGGQCCPGAIDPAKGVCGYASEGGVIKSDGADADDEDGGRGEDTLEAVVVLNVTYFVEVGVLHLRGIVIECPDVTSHVDQAEQGIGRPLFWDIRIHQGGSKK
ncbi:hypothetical protein ARMGADRAFT_1040828, partial [Armillaria gallica]